MQQGIENIRSERLAIKQDVITPMMIEHGALWQEIGAKLHDALADNVKDPTNSSYRTRF